jgi:ferrous iron transport protein B
MIALVGNPNSGKTSVFNRLTGMRQKVANFPGVTVERKSGNLHFPSGDIAELIDLPGTYSLFPRAEDERVVLDQLVDGAGGRKVDGVIYVADTTQFEKHLLLFTQIRDLGIPCILVCNMQDEAGKRSIVIDLARLKRNLDVPVVSVSARTGEGFEELQNALTGLLHPPGSTAKPIFSVPDEWKDMLDNIGQITATEHSYTQWLIAHHHRHMPWLSPDQKRDIAQLVEEHGFKSLQGEVTEITERYAFIDPLIRKVIQRKERSGHEWSDRLDRWFTHRFVGPVIFVLILFLIFQAIFAWAAYPMDGIDMAFGQLGAWTHSLFGGHWLGDLLADGLIAGLGGIFIFIPQIAILFFLISVMEESGYMARAVYLFDGLMQRFGLNGRSVVALVSGGACAIPAVMSTRTIGNWKERLITILVTPFISCSARIPIYTILVAFVVPSVYLWGLVNLQGLVFAGLYFASALTALIAAWLLSKMLKHRGGSFLMMELPEYRMPVWRNVFFTTYEKVKVFVVEAGKIILAISLILWVLASYGPGDAMQRAESEALSRIEIGDIPQDNATQYIASLRLEHSYAGHIGKAMEPVIKPLGYDWKIGIALLTSFAAREVFISTMSTIYAIGGDADQDRLRERMAQQTDLNTGQPTFRFATSLSLLVFYLFAMQCMSTLAIVKRETNSWKWPILQFTGMTLLAYFAALITYQIAS